MPRNKGLFKIFRTESEWEDSRRKHHNHTLQEVLDIVAYTLNEDFGWGPERLFRFSRCFTKRWLEYQEVGNDDILHDRKCEYTQEWLDARMRKAFGVHFQPFSERYTE